MLAAALDLFRELGPRRVDEQGLTSAHDQIIRERQSPFDQLVVEVGNSYLEAVRHAHRVGITKQDVARVVLKVKARRTGSPTATPAIQSGTSRAPWQQAIEVRIQEHSSKQ